MIKNAYKYFKNYRNKRKCLKNIFHTATKPESIMEENKALPTMNQNLINKHKVNELKKVAQIDSNNNKNKSK
jgi:hypothetical protein